MPTRAVVWASMENNDFSIGQHLPAGIDDLHPTHLQVHFQLLMGLADAARQDSRGADLRKLLATFMAALPHCQQHIEFMAQDPSRLEQVQAAQERLRVMVKFGKDVQAAVARMDQSQGRVESERAGMMAQAQELVKQQATELERIKAIGKIEIEKAKQESIMAARQMREEHQAQLKQQSQAFDQSLQAAKQAFEADLARWKVQQEVDLKRMQQTQGG